MDAILGREVEVATLRGTARLTVPPGAQHGHRITLADQGIEAGAASGLGKQRLLPDKATRCGSHHFLVRIRIPEVRLAEIIYHLSSSSIIYHHLEEDS